MRKNYSPQWRSPIASIPGPVSGKHADSGYLLNELYRGASRRPIYIRHTIYKAVIHENNNNHNKYMMLGRLKLAGLDLDRTVNYGCHMATTTNTRQRIISAAQQLIYARSYNNVGVQEICDHARVKKGSFYHFFPSKGELALAVLDQLQDFMHETIIRKSFVDDIPPLARIERFFTTLYAFHKQVKANSGHVHGCPFGNFGSEMSTLDEDIRSKVDHLLGASEKPFEKALEEAIERGDLPAIDAAATARAIFAYAEGIMLYAKTCNDPELIRELGKRALQLTVPVKLQ